MTDESPWIWLLLGVVVSATGGFILAAGWNADTNHDLFMIFGYAFAGLGVILLQASVVALGVSMGMTHHDRRAAGSPEPSK
jgi:hypothetical protein